MTISKKAAVLTVKLSVFRLLAFSFNRLRAQAIDMSKMTPDERRTTQSRIEAASRVDWKNTMDMLGLKMPVLVPVAQDTTIPPNLTQKVAGSGYWFDSFGSQVARTMWGNWTKYYESKANNYVLINPLKLKNGKAVNKTSDWWKKRRPEIPICPTDLYLSPSPNDILTTLITNYEKTTFFNPGVFMPDGSTVCAGRS